MIVEYLRYTVPHDRQSDFENAYRSALTPLLRSPYCLSADISRCAEEPSKYVVRIEWSSAEDHLQKFRKSEEFRDFFELVKPYVGMIDEMRHYERITSA